MTPTSDAASALISVHPILAVDDLAAALAYYEEKLGFRASWQWGDPPSRAGVARDGIELQLLSDPQLLPRGPGQVYFHMTGVEAYYRRCVERGATIAMELDDRPWGMKDFRVVDPGGNRLGFGEALQAEAGG